MKRAFQRMISSLIAILTITPIIGLHAYADQGEMGKYHSYKDYNNTDAMKVIEYGKDLGLGIRKLHSEGYTGKGVTVAYVDQPIVKSHVEFKNLNLHYDLYRQNDIGLNTPSFHGTTVLDILAGKSVGIAPESEVYYIANPTWEMNMGTGAESIRRLININKTLPKEQQIRVIGFSQTDQIPGTTNVDDFRKAIKEAEESGIIVLTCNYPFNFQSLKVTYPDDKNNALNYKPVGGVSGQNILGVPNNGISTATNGGNTDYTYWENDGGTSWQTPYTEGVVALGLQIDPTLTTDKVVKYMMDSAYTGEQGVKIINPEAFLNLVKQNAKELSPYAPREGYNYVLYNSQKVTTQDLDAIKNYASTLDNAVLKDVSGYNTANQIYDALKSDYNSRKGDKLEGIQIFGAASDGAPIPNADVPAFNVGFKTKLPNNSVDDMGTYNTDFFYSTFKNDSNLLNKDLSVYKNFNDHLNVSYEPEWLVARLPLDKGEIAPYLDKYQDYLQKSSNTVLPAVNFSNPIFQQVQHQDDMGYFIKERLDKEFHIINSSQYRLYGNLQGKYPVQTKVLGDFSKENLSKENNNGIMNLFINSHGQPTNIDQAIFDQNGNEKRISFLNMDNINTVLNKNYYNMILWTCNNAWELRNDTIVHEAMAKGKAINVLASTTVLSNNGATNKVSLDAMKQNNFFYFQYAFFYNYYKLHKSLSDSYLAAQKAYIDSIIQHINILDEDETIGHGNSQYNLNNALQFDYLGLLEKSTNAVQKLYDIDVNLDGQLLQFDVPPVMIQDRTMVPLRAIFEAMGATVNWNDKTQTVTATKGSTTITLQLNNKTYYVNQQKKVMDVPAVSVKDRTLVPVRVVAECFGATVDWDANSNIVTINTSN